MLKAASAMCRDWGHASGLILTYQAVDRKYVQKVPDLAAPCSDWPLDAVLAALVPYQNGLVDHDGRPSRPGAVYHERVTRRRV